MPKKTWTAPDMEVILCHTLPPTDIHIHIHICFNPLNCRSQIWGPKSPKKRLSWAIHGHIMECWDLTDPNCKDPPRIHSFPLQLSLADSVLLYCYKNTVRVIEPPYFGWKALSSSSPICSLGTIVVPKKMHKHKFTNPKNNQPTATKNRMLLPHPAVKLQGGHRTLILWRGVFASPLGLASPQLDHIEARKAVSPWFEARIKSGKLGRDRQN